MANKNWNTNLIYGHLAHFPSGLRLIEQIKIINSNHKKNRQIEIIAWLSMSKGEFEDKLLLLRALKNFPLSWLDLEGKLGLDLGLLGPPVIFSCFVVSLFILTASA